MTETKEVNHSGDDISGSVNNDPDAKKIEMIKEKHIEDKEVDKKEEGEEGKENVEEKGEGRKGEEVEEEGKGEEDEEDVGEKEEQEEDDGQEEDEEEEETEDSEEDTEDELENKLKPGPTDVSIDGGKEEEEEEEEEDTEDELENKLEPGPVDVSIDGGKVLHVEVALDKNLDKIADSPIHGAENSKSVHADIHVPEASVKSNVETIQTPAICDEKGSVRPDTEEGHDVKSDAYDSLKDIKFGNETISGNQSSSLKVEHMKEEELKSEAKNKEGDMDVDGRNASNVNIFDTDTSGGGESGTEDEQAAFTMELVRFYKERSLDFKPPKFYGEPLNLLKLWRSVLKLGGYDKVTNCKYWRQVGESFNPPKTCTTVSWTFRIFYEKALLDYERYRASTDGSGIPGSLSVPENSASGSGRARRVAAARAMEGWHSQRILDNGEVSDPIVKDKNLISLSKKEKQLKNLGELKRKKPSSTDHAVKLHSKEPKTQTETTVIDIGSPADWVKINVRETKDCYEVYALVPGLLREEVRVQSDPAGRLVISGEPENPDNPWCVTPFKKVVSLPSRIDPHQTSAVVTLHGQLFVRVPFEQYD